MNPIHKQNQQFAQGANLFAANGFDVNATWSAYFQAASFAANAGILRENEAQALDAEVMKVARQELVLVQLLQKYGLSVQLPGIGTILSAYEKQSDFTDAQVNMSGSTAGSNDTPEYTKASVPVPIESKQFRVGLRDLLASRTGGTPIDTAGAELATRKVAETIENLGINGSTAINVSGNTIPGLLTQADRETGTLTAAWTNPATRDIKLDVLAMRAELNIAGFRGPKALIVPVDYYEELGEDYKAASDKTIKTRLMEIEGLAEIVPCSKMATGQVAMFELSKRVVDMPVAQDITNIPWTSGDGMDLFFKIMAAYTFRWKSDANSACGIVHYSV